MGYKEELKELNESAIERFCLSMERIEEIAKENKTKSGFDEYFLRVAAFICKMKTLYENIKNDSYSNASMEELAKINYDLYEDILGDNYATSFANPDYANKKLTPAFGGLLSFMYVEIRGMIVYAYEQRLYDMTILAETFLMLYGLFQNEEPSFREVKDTVYWYVSDYADYTVDMRIRELVDPQVDFAKNVIMTSDLNDVRYLYRFGEYITDNEIKTAQFINSLPEEEITKMADTFTEGYRKGFVITGKDLSKKKTVNIRYCLGFERVVKKSIENFMEMGLETTLYRAATYSINKRMHIRVGYYGAVANKQMEYDHRFDNALYLDKAFAERKAEVTRTSYEKYKEMAYVHAGPAVMEVFGETPFEPENKNSALSLSEKQKELSVSLSNQIAQITNEYIKGEERSFTIIAYPTPEFGDIFEDVFKETVKINTLDYDLYRDIQQSIIDVLDYSEYVEIKGRGDNKTNIKVSIMPVCDHDTQTVFENCVADVNIPLGEVFTSPVLKGTDGIINVSQVYLNDIKFENLTLTFKDGMIVDYNCDNFDNESENKALIKQTVLYDHDTLPMGEFAIGTNTTAYAMANKYNIVYKLPILIVEKMGPHFAVGDTCYSWAEDVKVYNPDKKEIISRDNEVSLKRKDNPKEAYFNCHTDVTIPYDEIGNITSVWRDGSRHDIMRDGRFVLSTTDELNKALDE